MLEVKNLKIEIKKDHRNLIEGLNFTVKQRDKLAIIGEEGNGKSTLLKCIYDMEKIKNDMNISGNVIKNGGIVGYLEQILESKWNQIKVEEYLLKEEPEGEIDYEEYEKWYEIEALFNSLGLSNDIITENRIIENLSGGEKIKLQMIKILLKDPDILLLDEPTNDIDIETLEWLEKQMNQIEKPILFVSHDETLLEHTANCILHLEQIEHKTKFRYTYEHIGYKEYIEKRKNLLEKQEQIAWNEKREKEKEEERFRAVFQAVEYQQEHITRQDPHTARLLKKKMKSLKAREKRLEEKEITQRPEVEEQILAKFHNEGEIHSKKVIIDMKLAKLMIGMKVLKKNIQFQVIGKEKVCIIGKNGCGKTTLLKRIYEELKDRTDIQIGYMPQNYEEELPREESPLIHLLGEEGREKETLIRTYLSSMKFTGEEILGRIGDLSGGQKAKLFLVKLILKKCDVLLLDEPTRNLSPLSNPAIRRLLKEFNGAIISVSHDRKYIEEVCDRIWNMEN